VFGGHHQGCKKARPTDDDQTQDGRVMIQVVWQFIVRESAVKKFMRAYGLTGR
jgi:hypothetical protein